MTMCPKRESIFLPVDIYNMVGRAFDANHERREFKPGQKGAHLKVHAVCACWAVDALETLASYAGHNLRYVATTELDKQVMQNLLDNYKLAIVMIKARFPSYC